MSAFVSVYHCCDVWAFLYFFTSFVSSAPKQWLWRAEVASRQCDYKYVSICLAVVDNVGSAVEVALTRSWMWSCVFGSYHSPVMNFLVIAISGHFCTSKMMEIHDDARNAAFVFRPVFFFSSLVPPASILLICQKEWFMNIQGIWEQDRLESSIIPKTGEFNYICIIVFYFIYLLF